MKKKVLISVLLLFCYQLLIAQCPTSIFFHWQGEIDNFPINYPGCTKILGNVDISDIVPGNITNLDSLSQIDSIIGSLDVGFNDALTTLSGLDNLTYVGGDLNVSLNEALTTLSGLDNLISVGAVLRVYDNNALTSLSGLDNLTSVGAMQIQLNDALTSLSGLDSLTSVGTHFTVGGNDALTSLSGLDNINPNTITEISILNNPQLSLCDVISVCTYLEMGGPATISGNAFGCNSVPEIEAACQTTPIEEYFLEQGDVRVSPNLTTGILYIESGDIGELKYRVLNSMGNPMRTIQLDNTGYIDVSYLPNGLYFIEIQYGKRSIIKKIIKTE